MSEPGHAEKDPEASAQHFLEWHASARACLAESLKLCQYYPNPEDLFIRVLVNHQYSGQSVVGNTTPISDIEGIYHAALRILRELWKPERRLHICIVKTEAETLLMQCLAAAQGRSSW